MNSGRNNSYNGAGSVEKLMQIYRRILELGLGRPPSWLCRWLTRSVAASFEFHAKLTNNKH